MQDKEVLFPEDIYSEHLATINDVKFTRREIDVIACLLSARGTSKIASLLSIALRTVVTHISNVMLKLGCNSREGIIDFIERSQKLSIFREFYASLITETAFEKSLREISKLKYEENPRVLIIYWESEFLKDALLSRLKEHLSLAGINAEVREHQQDQTINITENQNCALFLLIKRRNEKEETVEFSSLPSLDLSQPKDYYLSVLQILKKLLPQNSFDNIFKNFIEHSNGLVASLEGRNHKNNGYRETNEASKNKNRIFHNIIKILGKSPWKLVSTFLLMVVLGGGFLAFRFRNLPSQHSLQTNTKTLDHKEEVSIRSDLIIPTESSLLHRPEIISHIDEKLKGQRGIQTVALVGPGGAGKTTLSRQYAHEQNANVIWEINAETQESLRSSFQDLAEKLAITEKDKRILKEIQNINDAEERDRQAVSFVKERIRIHGNWLLVFDNAEEFSTIQPYLPQDERTWGKGKVILTTRNSNIQNNKHINDIIQIEELQSDQKFSLFAKIMSQKNKNFSSLAQVEVKAFLENIPPYPLDISVAAYYLKTTNISYKEYLENLRELKREFVVVQENLLKDAGDYTQTRYGIITLSLQRIINTNKDFRDLLLFTSLLDSQNIPTDLLRSYKNKEIVSSFIHNLKKYSLTIDSPLDSSRLISSFSIHRSTQAISLDYLIKKLKLKKTSRLMISIAKFLENYLYISINQENFLKMKLLVSHCESFLNHKSLLSNISKSYIKSKLGCIYFYLWDYAKSKQYLEESIKHLSKVYPENSKRIAYSLMFLGNLYRGMGNYEKAMHILEQSIVIYKNDIKDVGFSRALGFLGIVYREMGNYEKAKALFEQQLTIIKKYFSENSIPAAAALAHLGTVHKDLGNFDEGKQFLEQSLIIYKSHSEIGFAWVLRLLGNLYREMGDYKKAKQLIEESLIIHKKHFEENHLYIINSLIYLGIVYKDLGNFRKAKELFDQSLKVYSKNYGEQHTETARILKNIGEIYFLEGNIGTAENFINRALKIFEENNHPERYLCFESLSDIYMYKYKKSLNKSIKQQALNYLKQALEIIDACFPKTSSHVKRIRFKLDNFEKLIL